jgi:DeoR family transcriptional regulator, suf operon transcriptional repressor
MTTALAPNLSTLPAPRRAILIALRKRAEASIGELAGVLRVTPSAVRQQLAPLAAAGLVEYRRDAAGPGRPRHLYRLAPAAEGLFPKTYDELALELLGDVEAEAPDAVANAFARRAERRTARALARLDGLPFDERVGELARILDEDGYLAEAARLEDGSFRITEHNCAILDVARRHRAACTSELDFLRAALPDAHVDRVAHMMAGAHVCAYQIRPRA